MSQAKFIHSRVRIYGSSLGVASIGDVCTLPEYEGLGAATRLLQHGVNRVRREGARLIIISGERGLYTRLGTTHAGQCAQAVLQPGALGPGSLPVSLRLATVADAALFARLDAAEPVGFERSVEDFVEHFQRPHVYWHAENWIIEAVDQPAGYVLLGLPWQYREDPGLGIREVTQYAGSRMALVAALREVLACGIRELRLAIPRQDVDLLTLLEGADARFEHTVLPHHTMRIIDLPGLMADLRGYAALRLPRSLRRGLRFAQTGSLLGDKGDDRYVVSRGAEQLELNGAAMTRLVMGDPAEAPAAPGALGEALSMLFPLPSFLPGINFR